MVSSRDINAVIIYSYVHGHMLAQVLEYIKLATYENTVKARRSYLHNH